MSAFAASNLSKPYLKGLAEKHNVAGEQFTNFIATYKESIDSIDSLRAFLIIYEDDDDRTAAFKAIF